MGRGRRISVDEIPVTMEPVGAAAPEYEQVWLEVLAIVQRISGRLEGSRPQLEDLAHMN